MKLRSYLMIAASAGLLLTSCGDDAEDVAPIIANFSVNNVDDASTGTHLAGDTISISYIATGTDLTGWTLTSEESTLTVEQASGDLEGGSGNVSTMFIIPTSSTVGTVIILTSVVTDKAELTDSKSYTVTVGSASTPLAMTKTGMFYHVQGAAKGAYDLMGDSLVSSNGSETVKDLKNTDAAQATFTGSFTAGNDTKYVKDNSFDYDGATEEAAATAYAAGTASGTVSSPAVGDIYIANLRDAGTYVVLKVTDFNTTDTDGVGHPGKITFSYKKN